MTRTLIVTAVFAIASMVPAYAQERMTRTEFLSASSCLAYAGLKALEGDRVNVDALRALVRDNQRRVDEPVKAEADSRKRAIRRAARGADANDLRAQRDAACSAFVASGLIQQG